MDNELLFYKKMKKYCKTKVELALRLHLRISDDKFLASKLHISPKRVEEFLGTAAPEDTLRVYNGLMALEERTENEEDFCRLQSSLLILAHVKAKMFQYQALLKEGYSVEEAAEAVERTPEKMMQYNGMTVEELVKYAEKIVGLYCDPETHRLNTYLEDMEF